MLSPHKFVQEVHICYLDGLGVMVCQDAFAGEEVDLHCFCFNSDYFKLKLEKF